MHKRAHSTADFVASPLAYRPDIQVLRAVAVVLVLLFHFQIRGFSAGFLGVDIFFVISGYLMQALYGHGTSPTDFYRRRARRLLPAYFALIAAVLVVSALVILPGEFANVSEQAVYASALSSNIGFWMQTSYFEASQFRPLLHLWSLGVEAQFYLLFPLLVRIQRRWLAAVALVSLAACLMVVTVSPKAGFFLLPFRVWEFALGMIAARQGVRGSPLVGASAVAAMLVLMAVPVNGQALSIVTGHPALPALAVTSLTAVALVCQLPAVIESSPMGRIAQRVGDASYSLYLAHFPVIVLLNYKPFSGTQLGFNPWALPLIAAGTVALYFGLERNGPRLFSSNRAIAAAVGIAATALALPSLQITRFDRRERLIFYALHDRAAYRCGKLYRVLHPRESFCPLGTGVPVLLVGDSHADSIKESFARVAQQHGLNAYLSVANDPLLRPDLSPQWLRREADRIGARWVFLHFTQDHLSPQLLESVRRELGNRLVVIEPTPEYAGSVPKDMLERRTPARLPPNAATIAYLEAHPGIARISTHLPPMQAGVPLYFDGGHLTLTGARTLEPQFALWFELNPPIAD